MKIALGITLFMLVGTFAFLGLYFFISEIIKIFTSKNEKKEQTHKIKKYNLIMHYYE